MAAERTGQGRIDPSEQIPEADLLEQQAALDSPLTDEDDGAVGRADDGAVEADEADRWEQQLPVSSADDEYPYHDPDDERPAG